MLTIAVVMTTFNGEEWLEAQLQSISSQTRLPERLVISDDGSTDRTVEIARRFARDAPFDVVLLEGPRAGVGENFWFATKHAGTEVIAWCDQDDVWYPHKLQVCERLMEVSQVPFVSHSAAVTDATLVPTGRLYPHYRRTRVIEPLVGDPWRAVAGPFVPGFTILVRADLLQSVRWEERPSDHLWLDGRLAHDEVISLLAFATGRRLEVSDTLASYRQHRRNLAGAPNIHGLEKVRVSLSSEPTEYSYRAAFAKRYANFIAVCDPLNTEAIAYFAKIEARCLRRSSIHQSPDRLSQVRHLLVSFGKGDFFRRSRGGFGALGLCRDVVALFLGANRDR
jgi:glycosyltransferase involved in cell wall biosynthesis